MVKDIKFKRLDPALCDIESADGEIAMSYDLATDDTGVLTSAFSMQTQVKVPEGFTPLLLHNVLPVSQILLSQTDAQGDAVLYHAAYTHEVTFAQMRQIGRVGEIVDVHIADSRIFVATPQGIWLLIWDEGVYNMTSSMPQPPCVEFGLQVAGHLAGGDLIEVDSSVIDMASGSSLGTGAGAWRPHPATDDAVAATAGVSAAVADCLSRAQAAQVSSKGYFCSPFLLRYALRLYDGTYIFQSAPILMLPSVLPPCVDIITASGSDGTTITIGLSHNKYFSLRYRITDLPDPAWSRWISAVDIFATPQIATHDVNGSSDGFIADYRDLISAADTGAIRGRNAQAVSTQVFEGHYSVSGDCYVDHLLDASLPSARVWYVSPNRHLADDLATADKFHLIASLPYHSLATMHGFEDLPLLTSDASALTSHPLLPDMPLAGVYPLPTAMGIYGGTFLVGASSYRMAPPQSLLSMTAYSGEATPAIVDNVELKVLRRSKGLIYASSIMCRGPRMPLSESFPRFLFYPDPEAFMMVVSQGAYTWCLPLRRHHSLSGAYWWGGFDAECGAQYQGADTSPAGQFTDEVPIDASVFFASLSNPLVFTSSAVIGGGTVFGICAALQTPVSGTFGAYPVYVLCTDGVWMLSISGATAHSARLVSTHGLCAPLAFAAIDDGVVYTAADGIYSITGSKVACISKSLDAMRFDIASLPHASRLISEAGVSQVILHTDDLFRNCRMVYDADSHCLFVSSDVTLAYNSVSKLWSSVGVAFSHALYGDTSLVVDMHGDIAAISRADQPQAGVVVTRPLKIVAPTAGTCVHSVSVLGSYSPSDVGMALYGSDTLRQWHLVSSARDAHLQCVGSRPFRYYCVLLVASLDTDDYLYGLQISTNIS